jgi:hypothetical protein
MCATDGPHVIEAGAQKTRRTPRSYSVTNAEIEAISFALIEGLLDQLQLGIQFVEYSVMLTPLHPNPNHSPKISPAGLVSPGIRTPEDLG